jgi:ATP-dependent protease ClpP protease subunit
MAIVTIIGAIDQATVRSIRAASAGDPDGELLVVINSEGGDIQSAFDIASVIRSHRGGSHGRAVKECSSAGVLVLSACDRRSARPGSRFLLHSRSATTLPARRTAVDLRERADQLAEVDERCRRQISAAIGCRPAEIAALERGEGTVLTATEALDLGLIDTLVGCPELSRRAAQRRQARARARMPGSSPGEPAWRGVAARYLSARGASGVAIGLPPQWWVRP